MAKAFFRVEEGGNEDLSEGYSWAPWPGHRPSMNFSHS